MKNVKKIMDVWLASWEKTNRKVTFPRATCDALRNIKVSAFTVQEYITGALATPIPKRTKLQLLALKQYALIHKECEMSIAEDCAETNQGAIFLLKSKHGYEDKQTISVENDSLADIIEKRSVHA